MTSIVEFAELREALQLQDWRYLTVMRDGMALASVERRLNAAILRAPNPHNLSDAYRLTARRFMVTLHTRVADDIRNTALATGTPYAVVAKHAKALQTEGCDNG